MTLNNGWKLIQNISLCQKHEEMKRLEIIKGGMKNIVLLSPTSSTRHCSVFQNIHYQGLYN